MKGTGSPSPIMASMKELPSDIWFLVCQHLNFCDLYLLYQSFSCSSMECDVSSVVESQAIKTIYQILTSGVQVSEIVIRSDKALWNQTLVPGFKYKRRGDLCGMATLESFFTEMIDLRQSFLPLSPTASAVKMMLEASKNFRIPYFPRRCGGEPHEPTIVRVQLHPHPAQKTPYLQLEYRSIFDERTHTVKYVVHHERFVTRTVA